MITKVIFLEEFEALDQMIFEQKLALIKNHPNKLLVVKRDVSFDSENVSTNV